MFGFKKKTIAAFAVYLVLLFVCTSDNPWQNLIILPLLSILTLGAVLIFEEGELWDWDFGHDDDDDDD